MVMKLYTNKKYNTIALYAIIVLAVNVLLVVAILKFSTILKLLSMLMTVLLPIIWGLAIAFLVNPIMVRIENFSNKRILKGKKDKKKLLRAVSVTISCLIFLGLVVGVIAIIVPEIAKSTNDIVNNFSTVIDTSQQWINKLFASYPKVGKLISEKIVEFGTDLGKIQPMIENILSGALSVMSVIKNFALGFILSIYLLYSKETLIAQVKKILYANFRKTSCAKVLKLCRQANKVFSGFIIGKIIDSIIIGIICFVVLTIVNMPYNILISVIVGVTNVIPFFGPFIGAIPSALLMMLVDPGKVIWLLLIIVLIQQFDGNILGPKILGDSTGLPAIWVMASLFVGGGIFGFVGMLLAVPAFALIYSLTRDNVENKLKKKKLPVSTKYYKENTENPFNYERKKHIPLTAEQLQQIDIPPIEKANEAADK